MAGDVLTQPNKAALNPSALDVADLAKMLSTAAGQLVTPEMINADIAAGAPVNGDGTLNLVHYAAWHVLDMSRLAARGRSQVDLGGADATRQGQVKEMAGCGG